MIFFYILLSCHSAIAIPEFVYVHVYTPYNHVFLLANGKFFLVQIVVTSFAIGEDIFTIHVAIHRNSTIMGTCLNIVSAIYREAFYLSVAAGALGGIILLLLVVLSLSCYCYHLKKRRDVSQTLSHMHNYYAGIS